MFRLCYTQGRVDRLEIPERLVVLVGVVCPDGPVMLEQQAVQVQLVRQECQVSLVWVEDHQDHLDQLVT